MYTNNTLDLGLMCEREKIGTQHKKCSRFGHIFVWMRGREVKAKHEKQGHFGRIFHAQNGMRIRQVPKHENSAKLAIFFRVWARVRVKVRSSTKTQPFQPCCSCREWGRDWIETQTREMQPNWPHFSCLDGGRWGRKDRTEVKHDKRGHFGRIFHAWNERGCVFGWGCENAHSRSILRVVEGPWLL